jgi:hypothetical protein
LRGSAERYVNFLLASTAGYQLLPDAPWPLPAVSLQHNGGASPPCSSGSGSGGMQELHLHFLSQCEHHMLPFHGLVHVAYLPGPSGRRLSEAGAQALLKAFSRRLQITTMRVRPDTPLSSVPWTRQFSAARLGREPISALRPCRPTVTISAVCL